MDQMPYKIKQKIRKLNRLEQEASETLKEIERELAKYNVGIETFMLTADLPVLEQTEDISNIVNGQVSMKLIDETIDSMERIFLIHAKEN